MPDAADEIDRLVTENKKLREQRGAWEQTTRTALAQSNRRGK
jgi:FtsZ-binding cell division protein ZapB